MRPQIESPALVSKSARRRKKIFVATFYGVIILASLGLAALVVAAAVRGQEGSPGEVAAIAGVAMLPGCVAGLALTARR